MLQKKCETSATNDPIASCSYLHRLITALRDFELLRLTKGRDKANALFGDFCSESYHQFLSDYIHFMRTHLNDAIAINECAQKKYALSACVLSHCKVQHRESRRRDAQNGGISSSENNSNGDSEENIKNNN